MNAVHYFRPSFLVSTLSSVVVWLFRQAAFLFIGIKIRLSLREDSLLLFMGGFYDFTDHRRCKRDS